MSDAEEEVEYEVESVQEARTEIQRVGRAKKPKLIWKFRVRWKGYKPEEDTWEPIESFNGSEHLVAAFWERTSTNGRDIRDLTLFQAGETFLPLGPPRHRLKRKSSPRPLAMPSSEDVQLIQNKSLIPDPSSTISEKRRHAELEANGGGSDRPSKRARENNARSVQISSPLMPERSLEIGGRNRPQPTVSLSTPSSSKKTLRRAPSFEVVPDSDEEMNDPATLTMNSNPSHANQASGSTTPGQMLWTPQSTSLHTSEHEADDFHPLFDEPRGKVSASRARLAEPQVKMIDDPSLSKIEGTIPAKAYAIARMNTEPSSSKSIVLPSNSQSDNKRSKPGPGRSSAGLMKAKNTSSLLTFSKGSLKTVKGKYTKEKMRPRTGDLNIQDNPPDIVEVDDVISENPQPAPPTGEELLQLAGFKTEIANALPDFEDDPSQMDVIHQLNTQTAGILPECEDNSSQTDIIRRLSTDAADILPKCEDNPSLADVTERPSTEIADVPSDCEDNPSHMNVIQPIISVAAEPVVPTVDTGKDNESASLHRQSVELAKEKLFPTETHSDVSTLPNKWKRPTIFGPLGLGSESPATPELRKTSQLYLNLDSSVSIPIALLNAPGSSSNSLSVQIGGKGPSGKFYHMQAALALLETLRASGMSAIVVVDQCGSTDDEEHFIRFSDRLDQGDIFVAISGVQLLVFCSSTATLVSQRLNTPTALLNEPGKVLVSQVKIEDYSGYADAAADADVRRWTQYFAEP